MLEAADGVKLPWELPGNWFVWWTRWNVWRNERLRAQREAMEKKR